MKLHYSPKSPFVRKIMVFAYETGLQDSFDRVRSVVGMLKPNAELMKENPWNKLPTLVTDDGQVLYDSDVIMEYLDTLHDGPKLFLADGSRWKVLRWQSCGSEMLNALILWRNERERAPEKQLPELMEVFELKLNTALSMLEAEADDLTNTAFSVGHIAIGCGLGYIDYRFSHIHWQPDHPKLATWYESFKARPSAQQTEPQDG